jgi:hypothetical protein
LRVAPLDYTVREEYINTAGWKRSKDARGELVEEPRDYSDLWIATLKEPEGKMVQLFQCSGGD